MSNDRTIAGELCGHAAKIIMTERGNQHGSAEDSFEMIGEFWSTYLKYKIFMATGQKFDPKINAFDVAQMMSMLKKARALMGNANNRDHYVDDIGYTALGGMMMMPDKPRAPEGYQGDNADGEQ